MRGLIRSMLAATVLAVVVSNAPGQGPALEPRGTPPSFMLLEQKSVQEELKLTEDQVKRLKVVAVTQKDSEPNLVGLSPEERFKEIQKLVRKMDESVAEILKPEQVKRLREISLQEQGIRALADPDIENELKMTEEQKQKIKGIFKETMKQRMELVSTGGGNSEEAKKKMADLRKSMEEKMQNVLTAEQKAKWKELTGEPFKGEIHFEPAGGSRSHSA